MKKVICLICSLILTVDCFPALSRVHYLDKDEKHFPIDEGGKHFGNLLIESNPSKNFMIPEQAMLMQDRFRRRDPEYAVRNNNIMMPDDNYFPYAARKNYENNNPIDSAYDGLRSQDDGESWNNNNDDKIDGMWMNTYTKPHYEILGAKRSNSFDNIVKRFKTRQNAENYFN